MRILIVIVLMFLTALAHGQTHTMPGSNVVPSGATLTINSGGTITAAAGSTITGFTPYAGTLTITTGKTFNVTNNLTLSGTDGSTLNIGSGGTLGTAAYTASTAYQATLTNSAGLRGALSDENGTGAALFSGATAPDFTTGFTIGAAAASGKIPIGNGTNYVPSTPTFSNAPSTALKWMRSDGTNWITSTSLLSDTPSTAGKVLISDGTNWTTSTPTYPTAAGAVGYTIRSDATNFASFPAQLINSSVAAQSPSTSDVYLTGSNIVVTAGDMKAKGQYKCVFDMTKSAGTGAIVITLRVGTTGGTGDAAIQTYTFGAGTSVADFGLFEVIATWRTVGSGTSAVMQGMCRGTHQLATTGLFNNAAGWMVLGSPSPSSGFNSSTATNIGISFSGSTAFAGTTQVVQAQLQQ